MRCADLITKRIRHLESALCASIGSPGYGRQAAVGPECGRRPRTCHIESRQQARGEKVPDAALLLEPRPGGVLLYHPPQLEREHFLFVSRASVCALEYGRSSGGSAAGDLRQHMISVSARLTAARERSPLKKCAHALTVGNPRSLRILEELIEESQLGGGIQLRWLHREAFERNRHALSVGVQIKRSFGTLARGTGRDCL